ncbi:hypothetical protein VU07_01185, partial [Desulfobulbus sp. F4]|nr:hypothetical protein [Desulfobulbus sp. F4]
MKKTLWTAISLIAVSGIFLSDVSLVDAADCSSGSSDPGCTCSEGTGMPPFLSSGAKPNLLMVLDNSGSMLDAAYSKVGPIPGAKQTKGGNAVT